MATLSKKLAVAVDLGATNLRVALVSPNGKVLKKVKEETARTGKDGSIVTNQIIRLIREITKDTNLKEVSGIGISSMGPLDHKRGGTENAPNVPFLFIPLVKPIEKVFSIPVALYKDTHAGVLAEKTFGAAQKINNLVYITISTGIGGGAIVDGKLCFGKSKNASEIGHLIVDTKYKIRCTCNQGEGHWEGLASGRNIPKFFEIWAEQESIKFDFQNLEAKDVFEHAQRKNAIALKFLDELSRINARAISDIVVAYDPQLITVGGSVTLNNPQFIIGGIEKYVDHYLKLPKIQITKLGDDIGLLGAAAAVFQKEKG